MIGHLRIVEARALHLVRSSWRLFFLEYLLKVQLNVIALRQIEIV